MLMYFHYEKQLATCHICGVIYIWQLSVMFSRPIAVIVLVMEEEEDEAEAGGYRA